MDTQMIDLVNVAHGLITQTNRDLNPMGGPRGPYWRFYVANETYREIVVISMERQQGFLMYDSGDGPGPAHTTDESGLRLFGMLVLPDPGVAPGMLELRYHLSHPLPVVADSIEPHTGHPAHP